MRDARRRRVRATGEDGAALELALLFLAGTAIVVTVLLNFASTSSGSTVVTRNTRGADYDADAAMQTAIAVVRVDPLQGYVGACLSGGYTPPVTLNDPSRPLRVDCTPAAAPSQQRHMVLSVCPAAAAAPCSDADARLRAEVTFYDDGTFGRALTVHTWSNQ